MRAELPHVPRRLQRRPIRAAPAGWCSTCGHPTIQIIDGRRHHRVSPGPRPDASSRVSLHQSVRLPKTRDQGGRRPRCRRFFFLLQGVRAHRPTAGSRSNTIQADSAALRPQPRRPSSPRLGRECVPGVIAVSKRRAALAPVARDRRPKFGDAPSYPPTPDRVSQLDASKWASAEAIAPVTAVPPLPLIKPMSPGEVRAHHAKTSPTKVHVNHLHRRGCTNVGRRGLHRLPTSRSQPYIDSSRLFPRSRASAAARQSVSTSFSAAYKPKST